MIITPNIAGGVTTLTNVISTLSITGAKKVDISGNRAYVYIFDGTNDKIATVDLTTNSILNTTSFGAVSGYVGAWDMVANPARQNNLYILFGRYNQTIYSCSVSNDGTVSLGNGYGLSNDVNYTPNDIAINKEGTRLFASRAQGGGISMWWFDTTSGSTLNALGAIGGTGSLSNSYGDPVCVTADGTVFLGNQWGWKMNVYTPSGSSYTSVTNMDAGSLGYNARMIPHPTKKEIICMSFAWGYMFMYDTDYSFTSGMNFETRKVGSGVVGFCANDLKYSVDGEIIYYSANDALWATTPTLWKSTYNGGDPGPASWTIAKSPTITGASSVAVNETRACVVGTNTLTILGPA